MVKKNKNSGTGLPSLARQINLETVIRLMRGTEYFSKIDLVRECGISTTTMSKLFSQLENDKIIKRSSQEDKSFGRPKTLFRLCSHIQIACVLIDVEETEICFSNLQGDIKSENSVRFPTGKDSDALFEKIKSEFLFLEKKLRVRCRLVGVCIPGLIEISSGRSMLNPNMHWMEGIAPAKRIGEMVGSPAIVMHEERALSRAQIKAATCVDDYIAIDFTSGVGMSVVCGGRHLAGSTGFAGEIGHVIMDPDGRECGCGNRGCLETIASDRVFQSEMGVPLDDALQLLQQEDARALECANQVVEAQARGIAAVVNIFNPEKVFVYSHLGEACSGYLDCLRKMVEKFSISISFSVANIQIAEAGKLKGAIMLTIDKLVQQAASRNSMNGSGRVNSKNIEQDDLTA